jgi:hypothetical protein
LLKAVHSNKKKRTSSAFEDLEENDEEDIGPISEGLLFIAEASTECCIYIREVEGIDFSLTIKEQVPNVIIVRRIFDKPPADVISSHIQKVNFVTSTLLGLEETAFEYETKLPLDWNSASVTQSSKWRKIEIPYAHAGASRILFKEFLMPQRFIDIFLHFPYALELVVPLAILKYLTKARSLFNAP